MKSNSASLLLIGIMVCAAGASAAAADTAPTMLDAHATHKQLMKECMDKQKSQSGASSINAARKQCAMRVRTQMQQLRNVDTMPPPADTQPSSANPQ
jgi:hypothetical protein